VDAHAARAPWAGASRRGIALVAALLLGALVAWVITVERMEGMDAGPGTALGGLGWFTGVWVTMMAAMMLPSAAPAVLLFARAVGGGRRAIATSAAFVGGYLAVWAAFGLVAWLLYRAIAALDTGLLAWDAGGPWVAGGAVALAGAYQLSPLKRVCLRHCRSPLHFLLARWRPGAVGAARMGAGHGAYCAGCCWALMLVLFAVGVMSIFWMAVVAGVVFAEKVLPAGERISRVLAVALVALGVWIAVAPASVPRLTDPAQADMGAGASMKMDGGAAPMREDGGDGMRGDGAAEMREGGGAAMP
jgi:predicted metal-binding membrane protein